MHAKSKWQPHEKRGFNANEKWFLTPTRSFASMLKLFILFPSFEKISLYCHKKDKIQVCFAPLHLREWQSKTQICDKLSKLHVYLFIAESCCLQEQCRNPHLVSKKVVETYFNTKSSFHKTWGRKVQINLNRSHYSVVVIDDFSDFKLINNNPIGIALGGNTM